MDRSVGFDVLIEPIRIVKDNAPTTHDSIV